MIEKFKDGETVQDYRRQRRLERRTAELQVKRDLRVRDGIGCRWPGCAFWKHGYRVEGAHLSDKGMGGDPTLLRTTLDQMMRLCVRHHQGPWSLHSGDIRVVYLTERKANGPCQFEEHDPKAPYGWRVVGVEDDFTFRSRHNPAAEDTDGGDEY